MVERFTFKEIPNTGLGFSKGNTHGRGIGGNLSIQLAKMDSYELPDENVRRAKTGEHIIDPKTRK